MPRGIPSPMPILAVDERLDEDCFGDGEEEGVDEDFEEAVDKAAADNGAGPAVLGCLSHIERTGRVLSELGV